MEDSREVPQKVKIGLPCDPVIPLLGIYLKKTKTLIQKDICTPMFTAALFSIAKIWKWPECPLMNEWIKKIRCIYTINSEILPFAKTWMCLKCITLNEMSEKDKCHMISLICGSSQMHRTDWWLPEVGGGGKGWKVGKMGEGG